MLSITRAVVDAVGVPVTAKTRLGWDAEHKIIVPLAEQLQDCGIQALTVHGRTRAQMYTGEADWSLIGEVKRNPRMHIPVIGNGDITSAEGALRAFGDYGVDAVMVGRATFGRPGYSGRSGRCSMPPCRGGDTAAALAQATLDSDERLDILKSQVEQSVARIDEYRGILHIRRHLAATPLFKGLPSFRPTRIAMLRAATVDELFAILESIRPLLRDAGTAGA